MGDGEQEAPSPVVDRRRGSRDEGEGRLAVFFSTVRLLDFLTQI
jgi:hypothetical protein